MTAVLFFIVSLFFYEHKTDASLYVMNRYAFWDVVWFTVVTCSILIFGVFTNQIFIYFQF
jgi:hypothetical protein